MIIASWNVNSIKARLPRVLEWLEDASPDVVLLQELKGIEDNFPLMELSALGYNAAINAQKTWNGVAILSKHPIDDVVRGLDGDPDDEQARYIEATINGVRVASIYLPNGNPVNTEKYPYKLKWMDRLRTRAAELLKTDMPIVLGGDYNIIPHADDCYDISKWKDDALYKLDSRKKFRALLNLGLTDAFRINNKETGQYTFWDYKAGSFPMNNGLRIDHFLLSAQAVDLLEKCWVDREPRSKEKPSDHTPILVKLAVPHKLHNLD